MKPGAEVMKENENLVEIGIYFKILNTFKEEMHKNLQRLEGT